ncbi:GNAT family N-acetyltransferase [Bacillus sp. JJ722]|uniref:GNAT family N-acetyltransferase n=1 Tax=Bacillus sp. JJ722 TaxID=3122973 RepID=UPI002FFE758A
MIELNTERLRIIPLNSDNMKLLIESQNQMEKNLALRETAEFVDPELKPALEIRLSKLLNDQKKYIWHTNWAIVLKEINTYVGGIMIKGLPNENGEVVIGYYTIPRYQGNGYMTETVENIKRWLLNQPNVRTVIADTEKDNIASHRVLEKTGAIKYKETEELYSWKFSQKN